MTLSCKAFRSCLISAHSAMASFLQAAIQLFSQCQEATKHMTSDGFISFVKYGQADGVSKRIIT